MSASDASCFMEDCPLSTLGRKGAAQSAGRRVLELEIRKSGI